MKKQSIYTIEKALMCLLNIHLSKQLCEIDKELKEARDKYIKSTIKLLELEIEEYEKEMV